MESHSLGFVPEQLRNAYPPEMLEQAIALFHEMEREREASIPPPAPARIRAAEKCHPPTPDDFDAMDIRDVRSHIKQQLQGYLAEENPEHMLLVTATPGSGKTWAGVSLAHFAIKTGVLGNKRIFYSAPRKEFWGDVMNTVADQENNQSHWYPWKARQEVQDDPTHPDSTCIYPQQINTWMARGHNAMDYCKKACGYAYIQNSCGYHAQRKLNNPIIFGQHAHMVLGHPMAKEFGLVIGDELPLGSFPYSWEIPPKYLIPKDLDYTEPIAEFLRIMWNLSDALGDKVIHGPALYEALAGHTYVREAIESWTMPPPDAKAWIPRLDDASDVQNVPFNYLIKAIPMISAEIHEIEKGNLNFPHRVELSSKGLKLTLRREINQDMPKHVVWFDGTGREDLYESLFRRPVKRVGPKPEMKGKIFQVVDRLNNMSAIGGETERKFRRMVELAEQVEALASDHDSVGVITYMKLKKQFEGPGGERRFDVEHFYGSRGTNRLVDHDVLLVVGSPQPPMNEILNLAKSLWPDEMDQFNQAWVPEWRTYKYIDENGDGWRYPVNVFADDRLNTLLWQYREGEIIQAAHRIRPLINEVPVYLLTNIPIDELPPTDLLTMKEILGVPQGLPAFRWQVYRNFANEVADKRGYVTTSDFVDKFNIDPRTARKYVKFVSEQEGWELSAVRQGRGRPSKCAVRNFRKENGPMAWEMSPQ